MSKLLGDGLCWIRMKNRVIIVLLCLVMLFQNGIMVNAYESPTSWAAKEVDNLYKMDILREDAFTNYKDDITRLDYAYLIFKLYESMTGGSISQVCNITMENGFSDCDDYYVVALYKAGIIKGYSDGTFRPDKPISREEVACFYVRAMEKAGVVLDYNTSDLEVFSDSNLFSSWAEVSILKCYHNGIINGYSSSKMKAKGNTSTEQSLAIMYRIISNEDYVADNTIEDRGWSNIQYDGKYLYYVNKDFMGNEESVKKYEDFKYIGTLLEGEINSNLFLDGDTLYYLDNSLAEMAYNLTAEESSLQNDYTFSDNSEVKSEVEIYIYDDSINANIVDLLSQANEYVVIGDYIVYTNDNMELLVYRIYDNESIEISSSRYENLQIVHNYLSVDEALGDSDDTLIYNHLLPVFYLKDYFYY